MHSLFILSSLRYKNKYWYRKLKTTPLKSFAELEKASGAFRIDARDFAEAPVAERAAPVVVVVAPSVTVGDGRARVQWRYG